MTEDPHYVATWTELKKRRRICGLLTMGFILCPLVGALLLSMARIPNIVCAAMEGTVYVALVTLGIHLSSLPCPRCNGVLRLQSFQKHCNSCGLPIGALNDPGGMEDWIAIHKSTYNPQVTKTKKKIGLSLILVGIVIVILTLWFQPASNQPPTTNPTPSNLP